MSQMLEQDLNAVTCNFTRNGFIQAGYSANYGVLGGLEFMAIQTSTTGVYVVNLKQMYAYTTMDELVDGVQDFDYTKITGAFAKIQYGGLTTTPLVSSSYYATNVCVSTADGCIYVYVYTSGEVLANLPAGTKMMVQVFFGGNA